MAFYPDTRSAATERLGATRSLAAITQHGAENVAVLVQGQMSKAGEIESAGISAVVKKPKEAESGTEG